MASELHLRIVTPDRVIVDRKVAAVTFQGIDGKYGILPHHAPLLTAIAKAGSMEITETNGSKIPLFVSDGFAQMHDNVLTLVCEAGEMAHEIDLERVKAAEARAREKLSHLDRASQEFLAAEASLRKAMMREMLARRSSGSSNVK
jgi:F-type H+-transporting ATPase subunit epsilon